MNATTMLISLLRNLLRRRVQLAFFAGLSALCLIATAGLTLQVFLKLDEYGSSGQDNMQWTMAQLEVDQIKLIRAIERPAAPDGPQPEAIRRRFDAFYSRAETLHEGDAYSRALAGTSAGANLDEITATLARMIPLIDAPDALLLRDRARLLDMTRGLSRPIRDMASAAITIAAARTDAERALLTTRLVQLAALSILMLAALLSLLILFRQLYHRYRRRAQESRATLDKLAAILETSQDAILVVDAEGRIVDTNGAADGIFGPRGDTTGTPARIGDILWQVGAPGGRAPVTPDLLNGRCAEGPPDCPKLVARGRDGREFPVELSARRTAHAGRDVCVCFVRDISRRVAAETAMQAARDKALASERARARFLGMISHEMRTPLNGILGALDLIEDTPLNREQARYAAIMKSSGQMLLDQINDALDITQASDGGLTLTFGSFDLDALLNEIVAAQQPEAAARNTVLDLVSDGAPLGTVTGDRVRLHQVILNLVSNAIKFTRDGRIGIEASRRPGADGTGDEVEFRISDTGIGIREQDLPTIFDDFVRVADPGGTQTEGTGLGLGIARHIVALMGGRIGAESVEGEGSLFWVVVPLPRSEAAPARALAAPARGAAAGRALDVLVVEDNANSRQVLQAMLQKAGHRVVLAEDGRQGVALAGCRAFDLILMDICMPVIDGAEAARRIRAGAGPSAAARIVALTAHFLPDQDNRLAGAGFDGIRTKPLRRADLDSLLAEVMPAPDPAPARACAQAPVDLSVLDQLCHTLPAPRRAALIDGIERECRTLLADLAGLQNAAPPGDLADRVHRCAGSAAILGATALHAPLARAEAALRAGDSARARTELDGLPALWQRTLAAIRAHPAAA